MQNQHWCMCVELKDVARDGKSTCSICGGRDAYGLSAERPEDKKKTITATRRGVLVNLTKMRNKI